MLSSKFAMAEVVADSDQYNEKGGAFMKIALVEPRSPRLNIFLLAKMCRGIALLAAILMQRGHEATCYVESIQPFRWRELLDYDIIGFSAITCTADRTYRLIQKLRKAGYTGKIVIGGPHVTALPEEAIIKSGADMVVRNEGDFTFVEVTDAIVSKKSIANILGISYMDRGRVQHNPDRPFLTSEELSTLPFPAFETILGLEKMSQIPLAFTRGCPHICFFCAVAPMFGKCYRWTTLEWRQNQWRTLHDQYPGLWRKTIFIVDDNCLGDEEGKKITIQFLEWIIAEGLIPPQGWMCQMQIVDATPEICALFKRAGCKIVCSGIESDNPEALKEMGKPQRPDQIMVGLNNLHEAGIQVLAMTIAGTDKDTFWSIRASIRRLRKLGKITYLMVSTMVALPGTMMWWMFKRKGRWLSPHYKDYNGLHPVLRPERMSKFLLWLSLWDNTRWFYLGTLHGLGLIWANRKGAQKIVGLALWQATTAPWRFISEHLVRR